MNRYDTSSSPNRSTDEAHYPILFGDPFANRASYIDGIFYRGNRRYLCEKSAGENVLQPPPEFMTRQQVRNAFRLRQQGVQHMQKLDFVKRNEADELLATKAAYNRKQDVQSKKNRNVPSNIVIQRHSSTNKSDWNVEFQAGCKMYINRDTGEVTTECPWEIEENESAKPGIDIEEENEGGSGSLVYDSSELDSLFTFLDEMERKSQLAKSLHT